MADRRAKARPARPIDRMPNRTIHSRLTDLPTESVADGALTRTAVRGDHSLVTLNWIQPHHEDQPRHSHPFDQIALIVEGVMEFDVGDETFVVRAGDALQIPAGVPHTARVLGDDVAYNIDIFAPVRPDYLYLAAHQADAFS